MSNLAISDRDQTLIKQAVAQGPAILNGCSDLVKETYLAIISSKYGIDPDLKAFDLIKLNGKMTLYPNKRAADYIRQKMGISITLLETWIEDNYFYVRVAATMGNRTDFDLACIALFKQEWDPKDAKMILRNAAPEERANLQMKCVSKAKRRVTLSICGLDYLQTETVEGE